MYCLDSSFLVTAHRQYYPFEIFPSFWDYLLDLFKKRIVFLPEEILNEIILNQDELTEWITVNIDSITVISSQSDVKIINCYRDVINHANDCAYDPSAKSTFAGCADSWIIAQAMAFGYSVVTCEVSARESKKKIKIPDICNDLSVRNLNLIEFIKETKFRI